MTDSLLIAVHAFASPVSMSVSVLDIIYIRKLFVLRKIIWKFYFFFTKDCYLLLKPI